MEEVEVYVHSFLTSALGVVSGQPHVTTALPSGKDLQGLLKSGLRGHQNRWGRF
jgi:hypothetical protein